MVQKVAPRVARPRPEGGGHHRRRPGRRATSGPGRERAGRAGTSTVSRSV